MSAKFPLYGGLKKTDIPSLYSNAQHDIGTLFSFAYNGVPEAADALHGTAVLATSMLTLLGHKKRDLVREIAEREFSWPLLYDPHPEGKKSNAKFVDDLALGTKTGINLSSGKTFSRARPANIVALSLHKMVEMVRRAPMDKWGPAHWLVFSSIGRIRGTCTVNGWDPVTYRATRPAADAPLKSVKSLTGLAGPAAAALLKSIDDALEPVRKFEDWGQRGRGRELPALSKESAAQWAKVTPQLVEMAYGKEFNEHPDLEKLKKSVSNSAKDFLGNQGGRGIVRREMLKAVKRAWGSIAAVD